MTKLDYFDKTGHLTEYAFQRLINGENHELRRLEISEHLSFCDDCLEKYLQKMELQQLEEPPHTMEKSIMQNIKYRIMRRLYSKYATMAVAASFAMVLWVGGAFNINRYDRIINEKHTEININIKEIVNEKINNGVNIIKEVLTYGKEK